MTGDGGIAIVGMACRYPDATDPTELWQTVLGRRRAFRRIPPQRLSPAYFGAADDVDQTYVTHAGLLRGWTFDRRRFGVPGPLYRAADQAHWLALQAAADALADAGFPEGDGLDRDRVGVVLGNSLTGEFSRAAMLRLRWPFIASAAAGALADAGLPDDVAGPVLAGMGAQIKRPFPVPGDESLAGALANTIAGRVCNQFDFHGTGHTVDGACSSSLLAVMTAARYLRSGELSFALAGGVDLSLDPFELVGFARMGALAVDEMRVYDAQPTGFLPGEGCGVVALMRAEDADRLGVRGYAELIGWGMSSDGAGGLTRPEVSGQTRALRRAYAMAGRDPAELGMVEGHGTGTAVGDEVELMALTDLLRDTAGGPVLGTVKANIGHTKAAAGAAGLIKAALAVHHRVVPPTTGCRHPHDLLCGAEVPLRLATEPEQWPAGRPLAGVSSMGFGGINTHLVVTAPSAGAGSACPPMPAAWAAPLPEQEIVLLRAASRAELAARLAALAGWAGALSVAELHDLAATLAAGTDPGAWRAALVADRPERLVAAAQAARDELADWTGEPRLDERAGWALGTGRARIGLLFPGQAAPVRGTLPDWATDLGVPARPAALAPVAGTPVHTDVAQPAIVWQSLAGLGWLDALGCRAVSAAGHSLGELTALVWAGVLSAAEGLRLAVLRGQLMARHGEPDTTMAALAAGPDTVRELVTATGVTIAGHNAPTRTTVAGAVPAVRAVLAEAAARSIHATMLPVSHGFHSPAMRAVAEPLRAALADVHFGHPSTGRTTISTVTGRPLDAASDLVALLVDQLTTPVRFTSAVACLADRCDLLVEVGPGTTLAGLAAECAPAVPTVALDCGGPPRRHAMATAALLATADADPRAWFADRCHRSLSIGDPIDLLANPCEAATAGTAPPTTTAPDGPAPARTLSRRSGQADPCTVLREHLAEALELPSADITPDSSLLGDLHLNSLQVVHTVTAVAEALGRRPSEALPAMVNATVGELAAALAALPVRAEPGGDGTVAGVADWVRAFRHDWVPAPATAEPAPVAWTVDAPPDHWCHEVLRPVAAGPSGLAVVLAPNAGPDRVADILRRAERLAPRRFLLLHHGHPAAEGVARSVSAEVPDCAVTVLWLPMDATGFDPAHIAASGYQELRLTPTGATLRAETSAHRLGWRTTLPLRPGEICLVTGGVTGITARGAAELAARTGCRLVLLGRSAPDDETVAGGMARLPEGSRYLRCDVADAAQVRAAIAEAAGHGPIRGLLHGAGHNVPATLASVDVAALRAHLKPKVTGLRTLLAAVGDQLRLAVCFGSIIGRRGLVGQSAYCVANDWMRHELESWATEHPRCRSHLVEWSLWSDIGMGSRLAVVDSLRGQGVAPIPPDAGAAALLDLLGHADAPTTVLLTSRFPPSATLALAQPDERALRFTEQVLAHTPGVEAVVSAVLAPGADLALDDHRIGEVPVLPAVLGLEAMAQTAALLTGRRPQWSFEDIRLTSPVALGRDSARTVRLAALTSLAAPGTTTLALREDTDGFATDRFTARLVDTVPSLAPHQPAPPPRLARSGPHPWYGPMMFHGPRFQRLVDYQRLSAFEVFGWLRADPSVRWFSPFYPGDLLLGDPGAHDAAIHLLMACVPHRRVLPVGVAELTILRRPAGPLMVTAHERAHTADEYLFDVDVHTAEGEPVSRWRGLRLRAVAALSWPGRLPARLVGPLLSRRLIECGVADRVELISGADGLSATEAEQPVGAHFGVPASAAPPSPESLGETGWRLATEIADTVGEETASAAHRVWSALRASDECGGRLDDTACVDQITDDGLLVLRAGQTRVVSARLDTELSERPAYAAIALIGEK